LSKVTISIPHLILDETLVIRTSKPVVPPFVTYELSRSGKELRPVLYAMAEWAVHNSGEQGSLFSKQMQDFPAE
jgi:DNA-binding HxlR family transcriptional regulator